MMERRIMLASGITALLAILILGLYQKAAAAFSFTGRFSKWGPQRHMSASAKLDNYHDDGGDDTWNIHYHLGGNGPWIPKLQNTVEDDIDPPAGCWVDQVHMVGVPS